MMQKRFFLTLLLFASAGIQHGFGQQKTQRTLDSLMVVLPQVASDTQRVNVMFDIANELYTAKRYADGDRYVLRSLALSRKTHHLRGILRSYHVLGIEKHTQGKYLEALPLFQQSLHTLVNPENAKLVAYQFTASMYLIDICHKLGRNDLSRQYVVKSYQLKYPRGRLRDTRFAFPMFACLGFLFFCLIYNLFLSYFTRDICYRYSSLTIAMFSVYIVATEPNLTVGWVNGIIPFLAIHFITFSSNFIACYFFLGFLYHLLADQNNAIPKYLQFILRFQRVVGIFTLLMMTGYIVLAILKYDDFVGFWAVFNYLYVSNDKIGLLILMISFGTILHMKRHQVNGLNYLIIGFVFFISGVVISMLSGNFHLKTIEMFQLHSIGAALFLISLTVSIAAKINFYRDEKEQAQEKALAKLELKVRERTVEIRLQKEKVEIEKQRSDDLLLNILPSEIADELKANGSAKARHFDNVSVLFTDFVGFTTISEKLDPTALVAEIHHYFTAFDTIIERNGLEKIKTIGDAYLAVCGLPTQNAKHAQKTVQAAVEIRDFVKTQAAADGKFSIRIGVHSGPVVAGIVGVKKFAYDIWGDTVNTAARMEQHSEDGRINISGNTYALVKDDFACTHRGKVAAKNKGDIDMYFVE